MLKRFLMGAVLLLAASPICFAQGVRIGDAPSPITSVLLTPGVISTVPNSTISVCAHPANAVPCTNKVQTYSDITLSVPCSTSTQVVLAGLTNCVATTDSRGNWGAWLLPGTYDFTVTVNTGQSFGPFPVSAGGGGAGPALTQSFATVNDETATLVNSRRIIAGTNISLDTTFAGQLVINATGGAGTVTSVGLVGPSGIQITNSPVTGTGFLTFSMPVSWDVGSLLLGTGLNTVATLPIGATPGDVLTTNGTTASWASPCPGATNTQILYSDAGVCAGDALHTWDKTLKLDFIGPAPGTLDPLLQGLFAAPFISLGVTRLESGTPAFGAVIAAQSDVLAEGLIVQSLSTGAGSAAVGIISLVTSPSDATNINQLVGTLSTVVIPGTGTIAKAQGFVSDLGPTNTATVNELIGYDAGFSNGAAGTTVLRAIGYNISGSLIFGLGGVGTGIGFNASVGNLIGATFMVGTYTEIETQAAGDYSLYIGQGKVGGGAGIFMRPDPVVTPAAPGVAPATPGVTTWGYKIVPHVWNMHAEATAEGTTATGSAVLNGVDGNLVSWNPVTSNPLVPAPQFSTTGFDVYRTTAGGAPGTTGFLFTVPGNQFTFFDDGVIAGAGEIPPTTNNTNSVATDTQFLGNLYFGPNGECYLLTGAGSPEGVVSAPSCSLYSSTTAGSNTTFYVKETSPTTNTGWVAFGSGGGGANTSLSNLAAVAINTTLLPNVAAAQNLGTAPLPFGALYVGNAANQTAFFDPAALSGNRTLAIQDSGGILGVLAGVIANGDCLQASVAGPITTVISTGAPCGGGGTGTVTTTGVPANGNLTKFSGSLSITNGDLSGDVTTSGTLVTTVAKVNSVAYPTTGASFDALPVLTASNTIGYYQINGGADCGDSTHALGYSQTTHLIGCQSIVGGGTGTVTSVAETFTGGLISVAGSPITTAGTLALTVAGTSGGVPYFASGSTWASSGALAIHGIVLGGGAGAAPTSLAVPASGTVLAGVAASNPSFTATPVLGVAGATAGTLGLSGPTSGVITIKGQAAAGTYNFNLPINPGSTGQPLLSAGGGASPMTFGTLGASWGGTGQITLTAHGVLVGAGTSPITQLAVGASGTLLAGAGGADPLFTPTPTLGVAGATLGTLSFSGNTSGTVTVRPAAIAGAWTFTLPPDGGTNGFVLTTNGAGGSTWAASSAGSVNSGGLNQLAFYATAGTTVSGNTRVTENGTLLNYTGTGGVTAASFQTNGPGDSSISIQYTSDVAIAAGQCLKVSATADRVTPCLTTDTAAGIPIVGFSKTTVGAAGSIVDVAFMGEVTNAVLGTGTCTVGQLVIVDTTTNGRVKCTGSYTAGTVIGYAMTAQAVVGNLVSVHISIR